MGALFYGETPLPTPLPSLFPLSVSLPCLHPAARVACCDLKWVPRIRESDSESLAIRKEHARSTMTDCRVKLFRGFAERVEQRDNARL